MSELPDPTEPSSSDGAERRPGLSPFATPEEIAFAAELAELDRRDREAGLGYDADLDALPAWDETLLLCDEDLVAGLAVRVTAADLASLDSIDPRCLSEGLNRVDYLKARDRFDALLASKRADALVATVGARSSEAYLPEVHLAQEISTARRTSRHAAEVAIELARALATTFPGFDDALRDGEVSEAHCKILVEKTRVVADEEILTEIERRVLPQAKRLAPGKSVPRSARRSAASAASTATPRCGRRPRGRHAGSGSASSRTGWATSVSLTTGRRSRR